MATKEILKKVGEGLRVEPVVKEFNLNSFDLNKLASDETIEAALGKNHLFDKAEIYALIGSLISKQANGEEGTLLNNGYANLFYTPSCVVYVFWFSDAELWNVIAWIRDDYDWHAGYRVFSPATSA